jgi:hypothetical protein
MVDEQGEGTTESCHPSCTGLMEVQARGVINEGGGTRTHDQRIKSPLLYRLSYAFVPSREGLDEGEFMQGVGGKCEAGRA